MLFLLSLIYDENIVEYIFKCGKINYTYDAAGRTLLVNFDGEYQRTVYDEYGRTVQEINSKQYNPALDNLPYSYGDASAGHTYIYSDVNNLIRETNDYGITTTYEYSVVGTLEKKSFDIYDYYYNPDGSCNRIDVNGNTIISYEYGVTDSSLKAKDGQSVNRTNYANGSFGLQAVDYNGKVYAKTADDCNYYYLPTLSIDNKSRYLITDYIITLSDNGFEKKTSDLDLVQSYASSTESGVTTIAEEHYGKSFSTVIDNKSVSYTSDAGTISYTAESDENSGTETISNGTDNVLLSTVSYDDTVYKKSYADGLEFTNEYSNGNIIADNDNQYTYDEYGELVSTSGLINASYTYDSRGNMTSKTVDGVTTVFSYNSESWQDQLTSVDDTQLVYDANGSLISYGDIQYSWCRGKCLERIADGENEYSYTYDENNIRNSKTVNGVKTEYNTLNGTVIAQRTGTDVIYFQYRNGSPLGFVYNDVQYFYITNLNGDVVGITDSNGEVLAHYAYDEWGKLLSITTAEEGNEEQQRIAELNPLRYRGYYYDNETGMYYLQSRYYNPEICRFISADGFEYINCNVPLNNNAYVYCLNNPVAYIDTTGTEGALAAAGTALGWLFFTITGLLLIYVILWSVISAFDGATVEFPSITFPSISQATPAEKADSKIKDVIKRTKSSCYWEAYRRGGYVEIGKALSYDSALARVKSGSDVFTFNATFAYWLARAASGGNTPIGPEIDFGKNNTTGYYWHYHTADRNGAHIFYI